jgi:tetratricopeptide repeat protein
MNPGDSCPSCGAALLHGDVPTRVFDEAEALVHETLETSRRTLEDRNSITSCAFYNLGALAALRGRSRQALDFLHQAEATGGGLVRQGFIRDQDFASLRGNPEFEQIVAAAKSSAPAAVTSGQ